MASDVETAARLLEGIAGRDERDPASLAAAGRAEYDVGGYVDAVATPPALEECTIAVLEEGLGAGVEEQVEAQFESCVDRLAAAGATIERATVEGFEYGRAIKDAMSLVELATHWRAGGAAYRRGGVVDENYQTSLAHRRSTRSDTLSGFYRAKLLAGAHVVESANGLPYTRAQAAREVLREQFDTALQERDALALPTTPDIAPRLEDAEDPGFDYARNTRAADLTRLPAISLPGPSVSTLPVGFQLVGRAFTDAELLGVAASVNSVLRQ